MRIEHIHLDDLTPAPFNPRSITNSDMRRLKSQILELKQYKPLLVKDSKDNLILGGNMRHRAYVELVQEYHAGGAEALQRMYSYNQDNLLPLKQIEEVIDELITKGAAVSIVKAKDRASETKYMFSDNDHAGQNEEDAVVELMRNLPEPDLEQFKIAMGPQSSLYSLLEKHAEAPEEDEIPELPAVPKSRIGEVYQLGNHRLMCGDSTQPEHVAQLMQDRVARMVFTDPPCNIDYKGGAANKREGIKNDKLSATAFLEFLTKALGNMMKFCDGAFYVCMSQQELHTLRKAFDLSGGHWHDYIIWVKNTFTLRGGDFQHQYEPILYGWNRVGKRYTPEIRDGSDVWLNLQQFKPRINHKGNTVIRLGLYELELDGKVTGKVIRKRDKANIWEINKPSKSTEHPTMKPVKLVNKAIRYSSQRDDIILDTFGGSGSTLIACEKSGRKCHMMELDTKYVDVIIERWERLTDQKAEKL